MTTIFADSKVRITKNHRDGMKEIEDTLKRIKANNEAIERDQKEINQMLEGIGSDLEELLK
ncbi:MAG: hypothetical protein PHC62_00485 [Candidatus Izemoplasmatales bacterium]|nr:hypothetical protein [Candidatus Izemoplasmatales bacterium]